MSELGNHPCGEPRIIATRNYKKLGYVKGEVKPCNCILCGPVEHRLRKWDWWKTNRYAWHGKCHKCGGMAFVAGESPDTMWCRKCYLI